MGYSLEYCKYQEICSYFANYKEMLNDEFKSNMINLIKTLNIDYLLGSCKEAKVVLDKYSYKGNLCDLVMAIYNKRVRRHQLYSYLIQCFENSLRSIVAIRYANYYNKNGIDDWFLKTSDTGMINRIKVCCKSLDISKADTFKIFSKFYLKDLQDIIDENWDLYKDIFFNPKQYNEKELPQFSKNHLNTKIGQIRIVRNEIYHNNFTK